MKHKKISFLVCIRHVCHHLGRSYVAVHCAELKLKIATPTLAKVVKVIFQKAREIYFFCLATYVGVLRDYIRHIGINFVTEYSEYSCRSAAASKIQT
jgi:hypothetical protein